MGPRILFYNSILVSSQPTTTTTTSTSTTSTTTVAPSYPTTNLIWMGKGTNVTQVANAISAWQDLNGGLILPAQAAVGSKPTWVTSNIVRFDGTADVLSYPYNGAYPMNLYFRVTSASMTSAYQKLLQFGDDNTNAVDISVIFGTLYIESINGGAGGGNISYSGAVADNTYYTIHIEITNATTATSEIVGVAGTNSGSISIGTITAGLNIGASFSSGAYSLGIAGDMKGCAIYGAQSGADITATKTFFDGL